MNFYDILLAKKLEDKRDPQVKGLTVTENGSYSETNTVYNVVNVNLPLDEKTITANGTYNASDDNLKGYNKVVVNVAGFELKAITPGAIATITDAAALPLNDLKISVEPVQAGSGDPSPTNVRPITGWTECNLTKCGKNLFDENFADWEVRDSYLVLDKKLPPNVEVNMSFTDNDTSVDLNGIYLGFVSNYTSGALVTYRWIIQGNNIGSSKSNLIGSVYCNQIFIYPNNETAFNKVKQRYNIQVEVGSTATTYESYKGNTYNIQFPSEAGTVYGGTLDVVSGVLTVDRVMVVLEDLSWNYTTNRASTILQNCVIPTSSQDPDAIAEKYIGVKSSLTIVANDFAIVSSSGNAQLLFYYDGTPITGKLVYKMATPITYQLDPTSIRLLEGLNNIFADTGDILEGEYFKAL